MTIPEQITAGFEQVKNYLTNSASANTTAELNTAKAALETATNRISELTTAQASLATQLTERDATIATLTQAKTDLEATLANPESEIEKRASAKALAITAKLGVAPVKEETTTTPGNAPANNLAEQFAAITDPAERTAFYRANKTELLKLR